jgi:hypothetical protein
MSSKERTKIGRACRDLVATKFSLDQMNEGYEAIYREVIRIGRES